MRQIGRSEHSLNVQESLVSPFHKEQKCTWLALTRGGLKSSRNSECTLDHRCIHDLFLVFVTPSDPRRYLRGSLFLPHAKCNVEPTRLGLGLNKLCNNYIGLLNLDSAYSVSESIAVDTCFERSRASR